MTDFIATDRILASTSVARVELFDMLPSTNDWAKQQAAEPGCVMPLLVVARNQTAGRGRGANRWWSAGGSLTFSLIIAPERQGLDLSQSPLVSLATAVAVAETLSALALGHEVGIHWPNDVFADGRKVAGILVEVLSNRRYVIGIGVNLNNRTQDAPPEVRDRAVSLADLTGGEHDPTGVLVELLRAIERRIGELVTVPADLVRQANLLCCQQGQTLNVRLGGELVSGRYVGIGADGSLVLETPQGPRSFVSGVLA